MLWQRYCVRVRFSTLTFYRTADSAVSDSGSGRGSGPGLGPGPGSASASGSGSVSDATDNFLCNRSRQFPV